MPRYLHRYWSMKQEDRGMAEHIGSMRMGTAHGMTGSIMRNGYDERI